MSKASGVILFFSVFFLVVYAAQGVEMEYTAKALRDPFSDGSENKPNDDTAALAQSLNVMTVQGLLCAVDNPVAIVDGKIYRIGSSLGGGQVVAIEKEGVTVSLNGKSFKLKQSRGKANAATEKKAQTNI